MNTSHQTKSRGLIPAVLALLLLAGTTVLSGCTAVGAVTGAVVGGALGGPEGAAAGAELGMYVGAAVDISILEGVAGSNDHDPNWYGDNEDQEWYAPEWYAEGAASTDPD